MQTIEEQTVPLQDLWIEIRSLWAGEPLPARELRSHDLSLLQASRVIRVEGGYQANDVSYLAVLYDPLTEVPSTQLSHHIPGVFYVDVFCRPGVTDTEGDMASLALESAGYRGMRCHAGTRYRFAQAVSSGARPAVERILGNPLIHRFLWYDNLYHVETTSVALRSTELAGACTIHLENLDDQALLDISRRFQLSLDLDEMRAIAAQFRYLGRSPTDVELESLALTWSEHCSHKTFKASIHFQHDGRQEHIPGLLQTYLVEPTTALNRSWIRSAFVDNAGIMAFDSTHDLAIKVETHNHPSALEPFGGANTGVGGVIRDILAVSAEPIANTDVLCFGPPDLPDNEVPAGAFHPRTTYREVVRGIADYGNNMGIPTVGGAVLFHPGYTANPLVYCGTLGLVPRGSHPRDPRAGDAVILLGGRTGRDGIHGATMSSTQLDRDTVESSTVQIGAPITEKVVRDVLPLLRDAHLYHAITDCGAGGLCSAVGEMGETLGVSIELDSVPLKYAGLRPWEIWLSEAQERLVLAVAEEALPAVFELCTQHDVEATVIGHFRGDGRMYLTYQGQSVADLDMAFLHGGRPLRTLTARWNSPPERPHATVSDGDFSAALLSLLAHPTIASKENIIRQYDHEVGAATVIKPLVGNSGPSDAAVLRPQRSSWRGVVVSHGINPLYSGLDPYAMALLCVDEALRNLTAIGGSVDRAVLLDNFCWGDVDDPDELGALVRAVQGCRDATLSYHVPFISGKDSLRNTSVDQSGKHSIPGTLLITAMGVLPDIRATVTMDLKAPDSAMYLVGTTADELGGSHYLWLGGHTNGRVPQVNTRRNAQVMRRLTRAIRKGFVRSCHDLSEGGLSVAAAEMVLAGGLGMDLDVTKSARCTDAVESLLFAESAGRFLVEIAPSQETAFTALFAGLPCARVGTSTQETRLLLRKENHVIVDLNLEQIDTAWRGR